MNDIRLRLAEHLGQVVEVGSDRESFGELVRHQQFPITNPYNFTALNPLDLRAVVISNLAASHDGYFKHSGPHFDRPQSSSLALLQ